MWRPEKSDWEILVNESVRKRFKVEGRTGWLFYVECGADAMLEALFKMAKESPTGTFVIDSHEQYIYLEEQGTSP